MIGIIELAFDMVLFPQQETEMKDSELHRRQGNHGRCLGEHRPTYPYALIAYAVGWRTSVGAFKPSLYGQKANVEQKK